MASAPGALWSLNTPLIQKSGAAAMRVAAWANQCPRRRPAGWVTAKAKLAIPARDARGMGAPLTRISEGPEPAPSSCPLNLVCL